MEFGFNGAQYISHRRAAVATANIPYY